MSPLPVVALPGIRGHRRIFEPLQRIWTEGRPLYPLDLPPGGPALAAHRLRLPAPRVHLLTGSYGGLVARCLPRHRVASLTCVGTLPHPRFLDPAMIRRARVFSALPAPLLSAVYTWHGRRSYTREGLSADLVRAVEPTVLRGRLHAVTTGQHAPLSPTMPALWIHGKADAQVRWTPSDLADLGIKLKTIPGGHFCHASHPAELLAAVRPHWDAAEALPCLPVLPESLC